MSLKIDFLGGNCPVQSQGTINGDPYYFRARGEHWSVGIGGGDPVSEPEWYKERPWGGGPYEAGWMPEDIARQIIQECADEYMCGETRVFCAVRGD